MPIPAFDHNHVLPPHLGDPATKADISPYACSILEFCIHFATTNQRVEILKGLVAFRQKMNSVGLVNGFQWINGSFTENIEKSENRAPNDLDLVIFYRGLTDDIVNNVKADFQEFIDPDLSKANYKLDHYNMDYARNPEFTVYQTRYWYQLFTHNRNNVWKGIISMPLNTPLEDQNALDYLNSIVL